MWSREYKSLIDFLKAYRRALKRSKQTFSFVEPVVNTGNSLKSKRFSPESVLP